MITQIALFTSIVMQFVAAFLAIRLTRVTKYNLSWILISTGFVLMALRRLIEIVPFFYEVPDEQMDRIFIWIGFITSLFITVGVFLIRKIFQFLKKAEDTRRESEKRIINTIIQTEEKERKRFAKDLHDGLAPILSTVKMSISTLSEMETDNHRMEIINNTDHAINEAIKSIKEISNNLSPHMLNNFGLGSAIRNFTSKLVLPPTMRLYYDTNIYDQRFTEEVEVILYRVVCELINNSLKHAQARNIEIHLNYKENILILTYTDDGIGFDVEEVVNGPMKGMGYSNILTRIRSVKGSIEIESAKKAGLKVVIRVSG